MYKEKRKYINNKDKVTQRCNIVKTHRPQKHINDRIYTAQT